MSKPIVFFDLETTGKSKNLDDVRIIEISALKVDADSLEVIDKYYCKCNNDDVPISKEATEVHGIKDVDLIGLPTFRDIAAEVFKFFDGCDIGGYVNSSFDAPILYYSFIRSGLTWEYKDLKSYDVYTLYKKYNSSKLCDVYKRYTGKEIVNAHSATSDIEATLELYKVMKDKSEVFEGDELNAYSDHLDMAGFFKSRILPDGTKEAYVNFGAKWKGTAIDKVDPSYFKWMSENMSLPIDTRHYAKKIYDALKKES